MNTKRLLALAGMFCFTALPAIQADDHGTAPYKSAAENIKKEKDQLSVQSAFVEFAEVPQLEKYFNQCYGCVVFPTIGKGGFGVGGAHGKGWVFKNKNLAGESKMTQVTVGFQVGGQAFRQIIFFADQDAFDRFTSGNFEFGAQASAAVITEGANAAASTVGGSTASVGGAQAKTDYTDGMAVFIRIKGGLMYEAALGGQKFSFKPF